MEKHSVWEEILAMRCYWIALCLLGALASGQVLAQQWRTEPITPIDLKYIESQHDSIDSLAGRHFGRQLNGSKENDMAIIQRLLDDGIVGGKQVRELQAMGLILGSLLKAEKGLSWIIYYDQYGRSRSLQVAGFDKEFIFPATQVSRKAEVGIRVNVREVYQELEQAVVDIRNTPPF